jgi:hypothetical protein
MLASVLVDAEVRQSRPPALADFGIGTLEEPRFSSMLARIFRPSKTAMQSGKGKSLEWVLEFEPTDARRQDPLMGWTQTSDTEGQVRLAFETKDEAVRYADQHGIAFQLIDPKPAKRIIKAYADNFAFGRKVPWTH